MKYSKEEYNAEPVFYCTNCLHLSIKTLDEVNLDVCQECGNTEWNIADNIDEWNKLYVSQYDKLFLEEDY